MKTHILKLNNNYYKHVMNGKKKAELRKSDRDFNIGDLLYFVRVDNDGDIINKELSKAFKITYIYNTIIAKERMCILSIEKQED